VKYQIGRYAKIKKFGIPYIDSVERKSRIMQYNIVPSAGKKTFNGIKKKKTHKSYTLD